MQITWNAIPVDKADRLEFMAVLTDQDGVNPRVVRHLERDDLGTKDIQIVNSSNSVLMTMNKSIADIFGLDEISRSGYDKLEILIADTADGQGELVWPVTPGSLKTYIIPFSGVNETDSSESTTYKLYDVSAIVVEDVPLPLVVDSLEISTYDPATFDPATDTLSVGFKK